MLAAALYLLEVPVSASHGWLRYLVKPLIWGVGGVLAALAAQSAYILISSHEPSAFGSSFTSALLWYRLLPSPTYQLGVLPAILLITFPMLTLMLVNWLRRKSEMHVIRWLGLAGMGLVLLAGGLVVSTKIGGGSNIHNLDAFIVLVLLVGSYVWMGHWASERGDRPPVWKPWLLSLLIVVIPVTWNLIDVKPFVQRDIAKANETLNGIKQILAAVPADREILFINQRQLLTFGEITGVRMAPEYEVLTLSELAISNNQAYLERFYLDLSKHRFAVIIAGQQNTIIKDPLTAPFSEENNAWVEHVSTYLLEYYRSYLTIEQFGIEIFLPK